MVFPGRGVSRWFLQGVELDGGLLRAWSLLMVFLGHSVSQWFSHGGLPRKWSTSVVISGVVVIWWSSQGVELVTGLPMECSLSTVFPGMINTEGRVSKFFKYLLRLNFMSISFVCLVENKKKCIF